LHDRTNVLVVRRRRDLRKQVAPFFERNPFLSCKQEEFLTFARIVRAMEAGIHRSFEGFERIAAEARQRNGGGRYRPLHRSPESRILRDHMPSAPAGAEA
jgi:hypothetical protein